MSRPLHQLREVYKSAYGAIRDEGHSNASLPMIATYVLALESALTAALDRGRVVEIARCKDGGNGCPCEYDMSSCRLLDLDDVETKDWTGTPSEPSTDDLGHGPIPSWCPLHEGPVTLVLKKEVGK